MVSEVKTLSSNLHTYVGCRKPVEQLIKYQNLSERISRLEEVSKDLQEHQWKKVGLYVLAGVVIATTAVLAILFFKVTLPYVIAHLAMGAAGDGLGILAAGHISAAITPLFGLAEIYSMLTADSKISELKGKQAELKGQIDGQKLAELRLLLWGRKQIDEAFGFVLEASGYQKQIEALEKLCGNIGIELPKL